MESKVSETSTPGQKTGKPAAKFIESYLWLKGPVRIMLYPVVGLAWLFLSTTVFANYL